VVMFDRAGTIAIAANGQPPFGHVHMHAVIYRILNGEPDLGRLSGRLREYVAACLVKDQAHRPTAQQVLLGLMDKRRPAVPSFSPGATPGAMPGAALGATPASGGPAGATPPAGSSDPE